MEHVAVRVRLLGSPEVKIGEEEIHFPYRKAEGLFYYLCIRQEVTREELIQLLWSEESELSGKKKLRDAIYQIRQALGKEILLTRGHSDVKLNREKLQVDYWGSEREKSSQTFLSHFYIKNCYEFEEWAESVRNERRQLRDQQSRLELQEAVRMHDTDTMQEIATRLLKDDPYNEDLYQEMMELYARNGSYHMAIRLYHDLVRVWKEELEEEPSEKTRELFHQIYSMREQVPAGSRQTENSFIGREQEIFSVNRMLSREVSQLQILAVEGEEGVGKSSFLQLSGRLAGSLKVLPLYTICYRQASGFILNPWQHLLETLQKKLEEERGSERLSENLRELQEILREMEEDREEVFQYPRIESRILQFFQKFQMKHRLVFLIDDMGWMDPMSFQILVRVLRKARQGEIRLIFSYRKTMEEEILEKLEQFVREDRMEFLHLSPFSRQETERFLQAEFPELSLTEEEKGKIYEQTEGNAFYLREMLTQIREKGFTLERTTKMKILMTTRVKRLPREDRELLSVMSVFPERIELEELEYLLPELDRLQIVRALDRLEKEQIIQEILQGWDVHYRFSHRWFQEFMYEAGNAGKVQFYHRMLAQYYEKKGADFRRLPLLAYHYERARMLEKSYRYQIRFLKEFYSIRNENFPLEGEKRLRNEGIEPEEAFFVPEELEKIRELSEKVNQLPPSLEATRMQMEMNYILARHDIAKGQYESGIGYLERCMEQCRECHDTHELLLCYRQQVFHGLQTGKLNKVRQYTELGLSLGKNEPVLYATFLRLFGVYYLRKDQQKEARKYLEESCQTFFALEQKDRNSSYRGGMSAAHSYLGDSYRYTGNWERAKKEYQTALQLLEGLEESNGLSQIYAGMAEVYFQEGKLQEAQELLLKARDGLEKRDYAFGLDRVYALLSVLSSFSGREEAARAYEDRAREIQEKAQHPETEKILSLRSR